MMRIKRMLLAGAAAGCCLTTAHAAVIGDMQMTGVRGGSAYAGLKTELSPEAIAALRAALGEIRPAYRADVETIIQVAGSGAKPHLDDRLGAALLRLLAAGEKLFETSSRSTSATGVGLMPTKDHQQAFLAVLAAVRAALQRKITSPYEPFVVARGTLVGGLAYAHYPFDRADRTELGDEQDYRADYLAAYLGYGLTDWLQVGLTLPVVLSADTGQAEQGTGGAGLADVSLEADLQLIRRSSGYPFDLGFDARIQLANGDADEGTGTGTTVGRVDLRFSRPFLGAETLRWYASLGRGGNLEGGADLGATNYAIGGIWAGEPGGKSRDWSVWTALTGTHLDRDRQEPGTEPYDDVQKLRFGAGRMLQSRKPDPKAAVHHLVAFEGHIPTIRDGLWSSFSFQATYGLNWLPLGR